MKAKEIVANALAAIALKSAKHKVIPAWSTGTLWTKYLEKSYVVQ